MGDLLVVGPSGALGHVRRKARLRPPSGGELNYPPRGELALDLTAVELNRLIRKAAATFAVIAEVAAPRLTPLTPLFRTCIHEVCTCIRHLRPDYFPEVRMVRPMLWRAFVREVANLVSAAPPRESLNPGPLTDSR